MRNTEEWFESALHGDLALPSMRSLILAQANVQLRLRRCHRGPIRRRHDLLAPPLWSIPVRLLSVLRLCQRHEPFASQFAVYPRRICGTESDQTSALCRSSESRGIAPRPRLCPTQGRPPGDPDTHDFAKRRCGVISSEARTCSQTVASIIFGKPGNRYMLMNEPERRPTLAARGLRYELRASFVLGAGGSLSGDSENQTRCGSRGSAASAEAWPPWPQ